MRAIDEIRAQHRAECSGLVWCDDHPVPRVVVDGPCRFVYAAHADDHTDHKHNLEWALDAARRLTTQQPQDAPHGDRTPRVGTAPPDTKRGPCRAGQETP